MADTPWHGEEIARYGDSNHLVLRHYLAICQQLVAPAVDFNIRVDSICSKDNGCCVDILTEPCVFYRCCTSAFKGSYIK
jgi:hypothetical protein